MKRNVKGLLNSCLSCILIVLLLYPVCNFHAGIVRAQSESVWQVHQLKVQNENQEGIYPAVVRIKRLGYDGQVFSRQEDKTTGVGGWVDLNSSSIPKSQEWWYEIEVVASGYNTWTGTLRFNWSDNIKVVTLTRSTTPSTKIDTHISIYLTPSQIESNKSTMVTITGTLKSMQSGLGLSNKTVELRWPTSTGQTHVNVTTVSNGNFSHTATIKTTDKGLVFQANFSGDNTHNKSWNQAILKVEPSQSSEPKDTTISISLSPSTGVSGQQTKVTVSGKLTAADSGKGIPSKNVEVKGPHGRTTVVTNDQGVYSLIANFTADSTCAFEANFPGDSSYNKSSNEATFRVEEGQPATLLAALSTPQTSGDTSTQFTFSVSIQGGNPPYTVYLRDRSGQNVVASKSGSLTSYAFNHTFSTPGTYYVHGFAKDASGNTAGTNEITIVVDESAKPKPTGDVKFRGTVTKVFLPDYEVKVEQILDDSTGHLGIGDLAWITAVNKSCVKGTVETGNEVEVYGKPSAKIPGQPQLWLEEAKHYIKVVPPGPSAFQASLAVSPNRGDTATPFIFTVSIQGGKAPYTVSIRDRSGKDIVPSKSASSTSFAFSHTFSAPGTYYVRGFVKDSTGKTAETNDVKVDVEVDWAHRTITFEVLEIQLWKEPKDIYMEYTLTRVEDFSTSWDKVVKTDKLRLDTGTRYRTPSKFRKELSGEFPKEANVKVRIFGPGTFGLLAQYPPSVIYWPIRSGDTQIFDITSEEVTARVRVEYKTSSVPSGDTRGTSKLLATPGADSRGKPSESTTSKATTEEDVSKYGDRSSKSTSPGTPSSATTITTGPTPKPTSIAEKELFDVVDAYIAQTPSELTDGRVPTEEDVFEYIDRYLRGTAEDITHPSTTKPQDTPGETKAVAEEEVFDLIDAYFQDKPSELTGGKVPTEEDVFEYIDLYFSR